MAYTGNTYKNILKHRLCNLHNPRRRYPQRAILLQSFDEFIIAVLNIPDEKL